MKKKLLLFLICQTLFLGFLSGQIQNQNKRLKDFGTFTMRISGNMQIIPAEDGLWYLLIHEKDTLTVFHNATVYSQAEIYLLPAGWEIDEMPPIDKSSRRYKELKDVRKIRIRKRKKSFAIIDFGPKQVKMQGIPIEIVYYTEPTNKLFISAVCKSCDEGYRDISKSFCRKIIRALHSAEFKK